MFFWRQYAARAIQKRTNCRRFSSIFTRKFLSFSSLRICGIYRVFSPKANGSCTMSNQPQTRCIECKFLPCVHYTSTNMSIFAKSNLPASIVHANNSQQRIKNIYRIKLNYVHFDLGVSNFLFETSLIFFNLIQSSFSRLIAKYFYLNLMKKNSLV